MKVGLHVGQLLQPAPGGIGQYVRALLAGLPGAGIEVVPFGTGRPKSETNESEELLHRFVDLGWPRASVRYAMWHSFRRAKLRVSADVVHAPSLAIPPANSRPLVVTVHDVAFVHHPELFTRQGLRFHRRGLEIARCEAAAIIVPSAFSFAELLAEGFEQKRIHLIPHGTWQPPLLEEQDVSAHLARFDLAMNRYILFTGTLEPRKGLPTLLDAFSSLRARRPELTLVICGPSGWGSVPSLQRPGIRVLGFVDHRTLDVLYRGASVLACPSIYEGFGFPILEAMARGCPTVISDAASLVEVANGAADLVPIGDSVALAAALDRVLSDPEHRDHLVGLGRQRAMTLTWERSAQAHAALYATL